MEDLFNGVESRAAARVCPAGLVKVARRKLSVLNAAADLRDLRSPGNQLEKLKDDRKGQHAIRVNDRYRVCFVWIEHGADEVEIVDYHRG